MADPMPPLLGGDSSESDAGRATASPPKVAEVREATRRRAAGAEVEEVSEGEADSRPPAALGSAALRARSLRSPGDDDAEAGAYQLHLRK